jgi:hypothetical protein
VLLAFSVRFLPGKNANARNQRIEIRGGIEEKNNEIPSGSDTSFRAVEQAS